MGLVHSKTKPTDVVYDSWGNILRADWQLAPEFGSDIWRLGSEGGETFTPEQLAQPFHGAVEPGDPRLLGGFFESGGSQALIDQARADPNFNAGLRGWTLPSGPGQQSVNAYNASLQAQGIDPSELPYGTAGQESTIRVLQRHGLPLPGYLTNWMQQTGYNPNATQGGGGGPESFQPGETYTDPAGNTWSGGWTDPNFTPDYTVGGNYGQDIDQTIMQAKSQRKAANLVAAQFAKLNKKPSNIWNSATVRNALTAAKTRPRMVGAPVRFGY